MTNSDDKCDCGHSKNEHLWTQKGVTKWAFLGDGFFRTPQEGRGLCRKCSCPEYYRPSRRNPREMKYKQRTVNNKDDVENRCRKCGRLLENHNNVGHEFKTIISK